MYYLIPILLLSGCVFGVDGIDAQVTNANDLAIEHDADGAVIVVPPDMAVMPDLTTPPDLIYVPVYAPDIQALITAMTCDAASCHGTTNPVATQPVLIPMPATMAEYKHNYDQVLPFAQAGAASMLLTRPLMSDPSLHPKSFSNTSDPRYVEIYFWISKQNPLK